MQVLGRAHVDRLLVEAFEEQVRTCEDEAAARLLALVCDLFVLSTVEAERGWFQEHGRLTAPRSKAVIGQVNALCDLLRPHARTLVDAFGVPDAAIAAPIAWPAR